MKYRHLSRNVIIIRGGTLGDFVLTLPLVKHLVDNGHEVTVLSRSSYRSLLPEPLQGCAFHDIGSRQFQGLYAGGNVDSELRDFFADSTVVLFAQPDRELADCLVECRARNTYWLKSRPTEPPHVCVQFFADLGLSVPDGLLDTPLVTPSQLGPDLWIHPGSGSREKNCAPGLFADFAVAWQTRHGGLIRLSFGEADEHLIPVIEPLFRERKIAFESLHFPSLAALKAMLLVNAGLYVGNDSGVSHLAAMLGIPCRVIFRATDPAIWRPIGHCDVFDEERFV